MTSSPLRSGASPEEELDYYKRQYEQLETDLSDFQNSSRELEEQLERDIENAEKNERRLKEQVEKLTFQVEEWKKKHRQSKTEANSAQNALQKEITTMRETTRTLQLRLRDTEVMNDDYERQARNTESSLEDVEGKYNAAIERGVLLEEEVKIGEQERESLRIETQRLRDELGDLKVESEITHEKLRHADNTIERLRSWKPTPVAVEGLRTRSPTSEASATTPWSPTASTPPPQSDSASDAPTPPSPLLSDTMGINGHPENSKTPLPSKRSAAHDSGATPRPNNQGPRAVSSKHTRGFSAASSSVFGPSRAMGPPPPVNGGLPRSDSLYQIRNLRGRMQKIEARVHSARSKLPSNHSSTRKSTPQASPRPTPGDSLPSSVTTRRSIRRAESTIGGETASTHSEATPSEATSEAASNYNAKNSGRRQSHIKRLSYGVPRPPSSAADRPPSSHGSSARPPSRANNSSARPPSRPLEPARPPSRAHDSASSRPPSRASTLSHKPSIPTSIARTSPSTPRTGIPPPSSASTRTSLSSTPSSAIGTIKRGSLHRPSTSISSLANRRRRDASESGSNGIGGRDDWNYSGAAGNVSGLVMMSGLSSPGSGGQSQGQHYQGGSGAGRSPGGGGAYAKRTGLPRVMSGGGGGSGGPGTPTFPQARVSSGGGPGGGMMRSPSGMGPGRSPGAKGRSPSGMAAVGRSPSGVGRSRMGFGAGGARKDLEDDGGLGETY